MSILFSEKLSTLTVIHHHFIALLIACLAIPAVYGKYYWRVVALRSMVPRPRRSPRLPWSARRPRPRRDVQASMPHRVRSDAAGHQVLELSFERFPALGQKVVSLSVTVESAPCARKETLASRADWLHPERFIESDAEQIRVLAASLRREDATATARAIYDWVKNNLVYAGYVARDLGALHALQERLGDCTEYADLVVALARASGIPARMMGGYVVDRDSAPRPQDYHNWAELHLDGAWRLVDAQKENWLAPHEHYIAFRVYRDAVLNAVGTAHRYQVRGKLQVLF